MYDLNNDVLEINNRLAEAEISFTGKNVLVSGGSGFLGSWVCDVLIQQGAHVICLDNLSSGTLGKYRPFAIKSKF